MSANYNVRSERLELLIVGRVLLTIGVASLTVGAAITAALFDNIGAGTRTIIGLVVAALMVGAGELLSRRSEKNFVFWLSTNLMSAGYALAYFFIYALHYVPGLQVFDTPYACWLLGPALAGIATFHGARNRTMRCVTPVFTLLVTGHASFHVLTSLAVVTVFGVTIKVAALGCFFGMLWCASLSAVYKRLELRYQWPGNSVGEAADWLFNRVAHEVYFIAAALNAMALPLFLADWASAPLWWALEAPLLLALSWRGANYFKHGVVGLIWVAAVVTLVHHALFAGVTLAVLVSVPVAGIAMGLAYRFLKSEMAQGLKVNGYCLYVYGAVAVAFLVPYVQCGNIWDAMPFWMIEALVVCGLGLGLRDRVVHDTGYWAALGSLVLFFWQWSTWSWGLVVPVVLCAYALSVAYSFIRHKGGWTQTEFLPKDIFGWTHTVTAQRAANLENLWSWVGTVALLAATLLLRASSEAVLWWSVVALALVALSVVARSERYRYQGLLAFALAFGKLVFWDLCGSSIGFTSEAAFTLYRAVEFFTFGASAFLASGLCFREEARLEALEQANTEGGGNDEPKN
jgi:hypothetical protein